MRISQINAVYGYGSTGIIVRDLQSLCRQAGLDCEVVYSKSQGAIENGYHIGNIVSNKLHALLTLYFYGCIIPEKKIFSKLNINDPKRYIVKANENMIIQYI